MFDPADILTHPDFTEVNYTWDAISQEYREKRKSKKTEKIAAAVTLGFLSYVVWVQYKNRDK